MKYFKPFYARIITIDQRLRAKKYPNCTTLAREIEVSKKTIARDIEFMRDQLRVPIQFDKRENGYYYTEPNYFLPAIQLKESDILALIINERILRQYENTPYYEAIKSAIEKLLQYLPNDTLSELDSNFISFQTLPILPIERHYFELLQQAILNTKQVAISYHSLSRDEDTDRIVEPYLLHNHFATWYLVGKCHLRNEIRIFALNRIIAIEMTNKNFDKPDDFSIAALLKNSFNIICGGDMYHVVLKFNAYQARWIRERQWHKSQKLTELEDGGLILEIDVEGLDEVKRWVMRYGAEAEVIEPEVLREEILREIETMSLSYRNMN
jgi:predicted DNA-binding transcriptional regulator YafY